MTTTTRRPRQTEAAFLAQVLLYARLLGWRTYHTHDSRHSAAGFPDLVLCRPPRLVIAELKGERGRPTPAQQQWLDELGRVPGMGVFLWRPIDGDWAEIVQVLAREEAP